MSPESNKRTGGRASPASGPLHRWVLPIKPPEPINPALVKEAEQRAEKAAEQDRGQDHGVLRVDGVRLHPRHLVRMLDRLRGREIPVGLLTMIVSLEAIFLSTFVMISQNRADASASPGDQQWKTVQEEDRQNSS